MPNPLHQHLNAVRRRLRQALASEFAGRLLVGVVVVFWVGMLIDRWLEPSPEWRLAAMGVATLLGLFWLGRRCVAPLLTPLPDRTVSGWIERFLPELQESLATAIEPTEGLSPAELELREETARRAATVLDSRDVTSAISFERPRRWIAGAVVGVASLLVSAAVAPEALGFYLQRIGLTEETWPRRVLLAVDGFTREEDGRLVRRVALGSAVELVARANLSGEHIAPPNVEARRRLPSGEVIDDVLTAIGKPTTGDDAHQQYRLAIDRVGELMEISLRGGDARLGPLFLVGERPPEIVSLELDVTDPAYLGGATRRAPLAAIDALPEGARVTLHGRANKPLLSIASEWQSENETEFAPPVIVGDAFSIESSRLKSDATFAITLTDHYGIPSDEPHLVPLTIAKDRLPRTVLNLRGVGPTITPSARIPLVVELEDDHGVAEARLTVARDGAGEIAVPVGTEGLGRRYKQELSVDLLSPAIGQANGVQPEAGQRLTLVASARDAFDLNDQPRESSSRQYELTIVSQDALLARLEQQEINLRRTFESTVESVRRAALTLDLPTNNRAEEETAPAENTANRLRWRRVADELAKSAQETLSAGEAFEQIYLELENNRVPNEDLKDRVRTIVAGLQKIGERALPAARAAVEPIAVDPMALPDAQVATRAALDAMQAVLDRMGSLENYNEVVAMLRQIISEQQSINDATQRSRREGLRRLLLD